MASLQKKAFFKKQNVVKKIFSMYENGLVFNGLKKKKLRVLSIDLERKRLANKIFFKGTSAGIKISILKSFNLITSFNHDFKNKVKSKRN